MDLFDDLAVQTGFPADQLKYLACMLGIIPLSLIFRVLGPGQEAVKHLVSIVVSVFCCHFCLGPYSWIHSFFTAMVTYALLALLPHGIAHKAVFVFALGYLSAGHIYRMYTDWSGWSLDFTGPQMILTIKFTTFAIDYFDGNRSREEKEKMSSFQKEHRIEKLPSILEFLGYAYFFPGFLAGPAILFSDYHAFINGTMFKDLPKGECPRTVLPALLPLGKAVLIFPFLILSGMFPPTALARPEFATAPIWKQMGMLYFNVSLMRYKYYFGWFLAESSCIASGFGYSGKDKNGNIKWNRAANAFFFAVELAPNIRSITDNWNLGTATWLKHYIYLRFPDQRSILPTIATYVCSAFWHGFYPGYYLFFISAAFLTEASKEMRRKIRPLVMKDEKTPLYPYKYIYDVLGTVATLMCMNYIGLSFVILEWAPVLQIWRSLCFGGHILLFTIWFLLSFVIPSRGRPTYNKKE